MLRGIFPYVASTPPSRRRGVRHASTHSIKNQAAVPSTRPERPADVGCGATRLCILDKAEGRTDLFCKTGTTFRFRKIRFCFCQNLENGFTELGRQVCELCVLILPR